MRSIRKSNADFKININILDFIAIFLKHGKWLPWKNCRNQYTGLRSWKKGEKNLTSLFFLSALRTSCLRPSSFCKVDSIKTNNKQFSDKKRIIPQIEILHLIYRAKPCTLAPLNLMMLSKPTLLVTCSCS